MNAVDVRSLVPLPAVTGTELAGTQLSVGDVMRARVMDTGAQGQPVLMLGGATLAMELPFPVTPGQSLDFTVLEVKPEVRLGVARPTDTAGAALTAEAGPDLQISTEARLLSRAERSLPPPDAPVSVRVPGAEGGGMLRDPVAFAVALRQGVEHSGLFYERHLAQWVSGQRTEEAMREEPQAAWARRQMIGAPLAEAPDFGARLAQSGLGDDAVGMIRQQVDTLQQHALAMRSELAPGLVMDWRVAVDEDARQGAGDEATARRWQTELSSAFGSLDRVHARLGLSADRLAITLRGSPEALARMQAARDDLEDALVAAGLQLSALRFEPLMPAATGSSATAGNTVAEPATAAASSLGEAG
jgi:hypothetical protein